MMLAGLKQRLEASQAGRCSNTEHLTGKGHTAFQQSQLACLVKWSVGVSQAWAAATYCSLGSTPRLGDGPWQYQRNSMGSLAATITDVYVCGIVVGSGG